MRTGGVGFGKEVPKPLAVGNMLNGLPCINFYDDKKKIHLISSKNFCLLHLPEEVQIQTNIMDSAEFASILLTQSVQTRYSYFEPLVRLHLSPGYRSLKS